MTLAQDWSRPTRRAPEAAVEPEDDVHGVEMDDFLLRSRLERGTLLLPDAKAMARALAAHLPGRGVLPLVPYGCALVLLGVFMMDASGMLLLAWAGFGDLPSDPFVAVAEVSLAGFAACVGWTVWVYLRDLRARRERMAAAEAARHGVVRGHAYVVGPDGIVVLGNGPDGPTRAFHPAASVREVVVSDEDPDHVTALVRTDHGTVDMHWLPRTGSTVRALASAWRSGPAE